MEKYWSMDETINQIKHLLLEKDYKIERLREALIAARNCLSALGYPNSASMICDAALKNSE